MEIKVSIEDKELKSGLAALQSRMSDLSPVMKVISEIVYASIRRNFEAGGRPQRWAPSLRVKREGGQTLIRKGTGGGLLVAPRVGAWIETAIKIPRENDWFFENN